MMVKTGNNVVYSQRQIDFIRLSRCKYVGPKTVFSLLEQCGDPGQALFSLASENRASVQDIEKEIACCERDDVQLVTYEDDAYPQQLKHIADPPLVLSVMGDVKCLRYPMIAMVGSRFASTAGKHFASALARDLSSAGYGIVSGLARGIDGAAHRGVLDHFDDTRYYGSTVAVIAGGIDSRYPPEHRQLYDNVAASGAVVSEMPYGTEPKASLFPRRNRIISGLSQGLAVIEAKKGSGSLITARFALEQGIEIFAVPGSPLDPRSSGCNDLIKQGAHVLESVQDILSVVETSVHRDTVVDISNTSKCDENAAEDINDKPDLEGLHIKILDCLSVVPLDIDTLIVETGANVRYVMSALLELEMTHRVERYPGNKVVLVSR